jgi:replicative DNA helicase
MDKTKQDFSKFGKNFQENLCHLILDDRPFADQIFEVLDINFLELTYLRVFVNRIKEYKKKYGVHPTRKVMTSILRTGIADEQDSVQKMLRDYYARVLSQEVDHSESGYVKDTALDFCKKQKLQEAMIKCVPLLKKSSFDQVAKVINNALKLGTSNDLGYDYMKDFEARFEKKARNPVTTGWDPLDDISKGGLGKGELGVVIAPTGAGKSMVLVHLGSKALQEGKNVVHYTLELADTVVANRYDSCITGYHLNDITAFKEQIYDELKDLPGKLIVKEYPTRSATIQTIKNHIEKMKNQDFIPDMIIVDYADLIKPEGSSKEEKRHQLEAIYEELRGISQEAGCPIWTASQTNRSGLNAEVITMESISEAFNKCFVADFIFSVSRTVDDKNTNGGRIFIAKNRNGPDGLIYPIFMDTANVKIKVLPKALEQEQLEDFVKNAAKRQKEVLQEKYNKFKGGSNK